MLNVKSYIKKIQQQRVRQLGTQTNTHENHQRNNKNKTFIFFFQWTKNTKFMAVIQISRNRKKCSPYFWLMRHSWMEKPERKAYSRGISRAHIFFSHPSKRRKIMQMQAMDLFSQFPISLSHSTDFATTFYIPYSKGQRKNNIGMVFRALILLHEEKNYDWICCVT